MISADFPYQSQFIDILGSKMHYIEVGSGDPILFLHGNPTCNYLWRNIIPYLKDQGRCLAVDLIGMGLSDKPDLAYRYSDHYRYLHEFIEKMNLKNITLVMHDWGGGLGFNYAMQNESNVKALVFMETMVKPLHWSDFLQKQYKIAFKLFRTTGIGWLLNGYLNLFVKKILPGGVLRKLSPEEMNYYLAPYKKLKDRRPLAQWPKEIPIDGTPSDVHQIISNYSEKLKQSPIPKLLLYATPGALMRKPLVNWCEQHFANLTAVNVGHGSHFIQEDCPDKIGQVISNWLD